MRSIINRLNVDCYNGHKKIKKVDFDITGTFTDIKRVKNLPLEKYKIYTYSNIFPYSSFYLRAAKGTLDDFYKDHMEIYEDSLTYSEKDPTVWNLALKIFEKKNKEIIGENIKYIYATHRGAKEYTMKFTCKKPVTYGMTLYASDIAYKLRSHFISHGPYHTLYSGVSQIDLYNDSVVCSYDDA